MVRGLGVRCRYADDLVVMCRSRQEAEQTLAALRIMLGGLGLALKEAKTRIVYLEEGGEGLDFLDFHHRWVRRRAKRGGRRLKFLARLPSRKAMQTARDHRRELTSRKRLRLPIDQVVEEMNRFLQGWAGNFQYGISALHFGRIRNYGLTRLAILVGNRHKKPRSYGWESVVYLSPDNLALISLNGSVRASRPNRPWRVTLNAAGEGRR